MKEVETVNIKNYLNCHPEIYKYLSQGLAPRVDVSSQYANLFERKEVFCVGYFEGKGTPYLITDFNNYLFTDVISMYKERELSKVIVDGKVIFESDKPVTIEIKKEKY